MHQHYPFRLTCSTGSIKNISYVGRGDFRRTPFHFVIVGQSFTLLQEFIKVDGSQVPRIPLNFTVKDNNLLQRLTQPEYAKSSIILKLLPYEEVAYLRIIDDILHLGWRAGCIKRYSHHTVSIRTEIHI